VERCFPELPGWHFSLDELSAGVYEVVAADDQGSRFEAKGIDPDNLLRRTREYGSELLLADKRNVQ
jgi:hypothetical protein